CNVKEPFSGDYVIIAEEDLLDRCIPNDENTRIIPFNSLGGKGILKGFKPDIIKINGVEIKDVYIGICKNVIKGDIRALIPYEISKNIE
ncbi:MAG: sigma-E processing peptidase SpoIIGA, partial [Ruminococcus sp.]